MSIKDKQLEMMIHRYISGQLPEDDALAFEASFLADPDLIAMIEAEQALRQGLIAVEQGSINTKTERRIDASQAKAEPLYRKLINWLIRPIPVPAMAMSLLVIGIIPFISMMTDEQSSPGNIMIVNGASTVTRTIEGAQANMVMDLSTPGQAASAVMIKVQTSLPPYAKYRLRIISSYTSEVVWVSTPFGLNGLGHGLVIVPDKAAINDAIIEVAGVGNKGQEIIVKFCHYSEVCR